jgi:hypothetical protein
LAFVRVSRRSPLTNNKIAGWLTVTANTGTETLAVKQESPPLIGLTLESEADPGPEGLLVSFNCALEARIKGPLTGEQREDVNQIKKAFEMHLSGKLQTEIDNKGEALMVSTTPGSEGGGGGNSVLLGADPNSLFGDATSGEVTPVLFTAILSIPGFHVPIEAGVHYFLTFLPLGPSGNHFNGSRISYGFGATESVLFVGEYSGGNNKESANAQKKNAIEESPGLPNYEWWLEENEAPISIWALGTKT